MSRSKGSAARVRRFDPNRRAHIAEAALDVVRKWGVEGLTHRRVATAAGVPLGSTTYHFSSSDDLLATAIELAALRNKEFWDLWAEQLPPGPDLAEELTKLLIEEFLSKARNRSIVQLELYLAAIRRPALRKLSMAWGKVVYDALLQHTDTDTARALSLMLDSLATESLIAGEAPSRRDCVTMFRRVLIGENARERAASTCRALSR